MKHKKNAYDNSLERKKIAFWFVKNVFENNPRWNMFLSEEKELKPISDSIKAIKLTEPIYPKSLNLVDISNKQVAQLPFNNITLCILCGTLLGDTSLSLHKNDANCRLQARHSTRQCEWFMWKYLVILGDYHNVTGVVYTYQSDKQVDSTPYPGENYYGKLKIASTAHEHFTAVYKILYEKEKLRIKRSWLNHMNNYFLMTLWLDDGSLTNGHQGVFCLNSKPVEEQKIFIDYMKVVWKWDLALTPQTIKTKDGETVPNIMKNGQLSYAIRFTNQKHLLEFLKLIAPLVPVRQMLYKLCFYTEKNMSLSQRWKTELKTLVKAEFQADIDFIYSKLEAGESANGLFVY